MMALCMQPFSECQFWHVPLCIARKSGFCTYVQYWGIGQLGTTKAAVCLVAEAYPAYGTIEGERKRLRPLYAMQKAF
jgi:hypothetical protein